MPHASHQMLRAFSLLGTHCTASESLTSKGDRNTSSLVSSIHPPFLHCRFDGRSLLDFVREFDPRRAAIHRQQMSDAQMEVEEEAAFEGYRDAVRLLGMGCECCKGGKAVRNKRGRRREEGGGRG